MPRKTSKHPIRLTNKFVTGLIGDVMWWDDHPAATGFGIRSYAGGSKSFFIDYRLHGRHRRYTIGPFPRWSAEAAREEAKKLRKRIDQGVDPAGDKRARRTAPTIQDLIDRYIEDHLPKKTITGPRLNDEKRMLTEIGDKLGKHTRVADIHDGDIEVMHRKISNSIGRSGKPRIMAEVAAPVVEEKSNSPATSAAIAVGGDIMTSCGSICSAAKKPLSLPK